MDESGYVIFVYFFTIILLAFFMFRSITQLRLQTKILKTNETKI